MGNKTKRYIAFIVWVGFGYMLGSSFGASDTSETRLVDKDNQHLAIERSVDMNTFWEVWEVVNKEFVYEERIDDTEARANGAIRGALSALDDPYTLFMDAEESTSFDQNLGGEIEGIGAEVTTKNGLITVVSPLKGSPAFNAGILPGDIIATIDKESTHNMHLGQAVNKIRGKRGTKVMLEILRGGEDELLNFEITRDKVHFDSVKWEMKEGGIAHIELIQFDDNTRALLNSAINEILLENPKGLILDVRNNSGGYLDGAVDVLSEFTDERKTAVVIKSRDGSSNQILKTSGNSRLESIPMVVLLNEGSASASEIVAGALKDWDRAKLFGQKSFGKGSVQELRPLKDGATLRITIAKWYTPKDVNIDKAGIMPDYIVELTKENHNADTDPQMDCAIEFLTKGSICAVAKESLGMNTITE